MPGRKPKPTMLAELHGRTSHGRKTNPDEPKPIGNLSDVPHWFSDEQKSAWVYALNHAPPGLLKRLDRGALTAFIVAEDLHRQATIQQNNSGDLILKAQGEKAAVYPQQSPYLPIINRQALIMMKAASELGFTPVSRPRVFAGPSAPGLAFDVPTANRAEKRGVVALDDYLASPPARPAVH